MNIAFLANSNPENINHWSGTTRHIFQALSCRHNITWLSSNIVDGGLWHHRFLGKQDRYYPENYVLEFGRIQSSRISQGNFDIVVLRDYYLGINLDVAIPVVYRSDATFNQLRRLLDIHDKNYEELTELTEFLPK